MTVRDIVENLPAHVVTGSDGYRDLEIGKVLAGDMMSDMLVSLDSDALLVTSLATEQTVRCADMIGASVILLVNDKLPLPEMKTIAEDCGITILATPMPMYESCLTLGFLQSTRHNADS